MSMRWNIAWLAGTAMGCLVAFTGCQNSSARIAAHADEFARLDASTQAKVRTGAIEPGFTAAMVTMALGRPAAVSVTGPGQEIWEYRRDPITAPNETIQSGFRRRVVYDPVKRTEDVIIEPIDTKAFPSLQPRTLRVTVDHGIVSRVDTVVRR